MSSPLIKVVTVVAVVVVVAQATLSLWGLSLVPGPINYDRAGTWGDWVSAAGSVTAVWVALWQTSKQLRIANNERALAVRDRMTAVRFWIESAMSDGSSVAGLIRIENATGSVVFDWRLLRGTDELASLAQDGPLVPGSNKFMESDPLLERTPGEIVLEFSDTRGSKWKVDESGRVAIGG